MKNIKVSIIVPVYKTEKYLKRCLDSLLNQTLEDIEIILVDDGSPDSAPALCDNAAKTDGRIKVIHKKNEGLGMARNTGMDAACGEYIGFVDSDDFVKTNMYEYLYNTAVRHNADLIISGTCYVGGNIFGKENEYKEEVFFDKETIFETEGDRKKLLLGTAGALPNEERDCRYGASVCKNLYKRETVIKNNVRFLSEREYLSEDTLFNIDFITHIKKAVGTEKVFYYYCRNGASLSKSYNPDRLRKSMIFVQILQKKLAAQIPGDEYVIYLKRLAQSLGRVLCSQEIMYALENKLPYRKLRGNLKKICTGAMISDALKSYPLHKLPAKQAIFAFLMKHRLYLMQKITVILRK